MVYESYIPLTELGFVAKTSRTIQRLDKSLFDLSKVSGKNSIHLQNSTVYDTLDLMGKIAVRDSLDLRKLGQKLKSTTLAKTLENNFNWLYAHIDYKLDESGIEQVRTPLRLIKDQYGDCDCFSTFFGALLNVQGINYAFRMAKYKGDWQHVYIVVPKNQQVPDLENRNNYWVLDAVLDSFNEEHPYSQKYDKIMQLTELNGLGMMHRKSVIFSNKQEEDYMKRLVNKALHCNPNHAVRRQMSGLLEMWENTPARDKYLMELSGVYGLGQIGEIGKLKIFSAIKKVADNFADTKVGKVVTTPLKVVQKGAQWVGDTKVGNFVQKYNPLYLAGRSSYLAFLSNDLSLPNKVSHAERLGWALMPEEQFRRISNDMELYQTRKEELRKVIKKWVDDMGGREADLVRAIKDGFNKSIQKANKRGSGATKALEQLKGLGIEPVTTAAVITAATTIAGVMASLFLAKGDRDFQLKQIEEQKRVEEMAFAQQGTQAQYSDSQTPPSTQVESNNGKIMLFGLGVLTLGTVSYLIYKNKNN